jgi:hypothetical protein
VTFSIKALAGSGVAYEFEPHGVTFAVPLILEQRLSDTRAKSTNAPVLEGGHFQSRDALNQSTLTATVDEFLPTVIDWKNNKVSFSVSHFSGYLLASGRQAIQQR